MIKPIVDGIQYITGIGMPILTDSIVKSLLAEHLTALVTGFPDPIGADGDEQLFPQAGFVGSAQKRIIGRTVRFYSASDKQLQVRWKRRIRNSLSGAISKSMSFSQSN